jgi:ribose transport system ATP-binding protein
VLLARLLCLEPKVLLLDEPTRGIDVGAKAEVQGLVEELAQQGLAVLLISSELEELVEGSTGSWCCATAPWSTCSPTSGWTPAAS